MLHKEFGGFRYENIQCFCILQCSEYCAILGVLCALCFVRVIIIIIKKIVGFFAMPNFAVEAQLKLQLR